MRDIGQILNKHNSVDLGCLVHQQVFSSGNTGLDNNQYAQSYLLQGAYPKHVVRLDGDFVCFNLTVQCSWIDHNDAFAGG